MYFSGDMWHYKTWCSCSDKIKWFWHFCLCLYIDSKELSMNFWIRKVGALRRVLRVSHIIITHCTTVPSSPPDNDVYLSIPPWSATWWRYDRGFTSPIATLVDEEREARVLRKKECFPQLEYNKPARSDHENSSPGSSQRWLDLSLCSTLGFFFHINKLTAGQAAYSLENLIAKLTIIPFSLRITIAPVSPPVSALPVQCVMQTVHKASVQAVESHYNAQSGLITAGEKLSEIVRDLFGN